MLFALAVVCHGFGPLVLPQRAIHVFCLVLHWVSSIARTLTVTCRRLGPFILSYSASSVDFGAVRMLMNGLTCDTTVFVFSLTNSYRNLNWYILQTIKNEYSTGVQLKIFPCICLDVVHCKMSDGWRLFSS